MSDPSNAWLASAAVRDFLTRHADDDPAALALRKPPAAGWNMLLLARQVAGRQQIRRKLPTWHAAPGVLYPPTRALEQCSSERLARWRATLPGAAVHVADLTGGFGVDATCFARAGHRVHCVEAEPALTALAAHNGPLLGATAVEWRTGSAEAWPDRADLIYLDPDRREEGRRLVPLERCRPNVVALRNRLLQRAPVLLVKAAPGLDLDRAMGQLPGTTDVWVVADGGEVKEVLLRVVAAAGPEAHLHAVQLRATTAETFTFTRTEEAAAAVTWAAPAAYVYEPHGALLKAGAFRTVAARYGLRKLHPNSHLYTSDVRVTAFPGRTWRVEAVTTLNRREVSRYFPDGRAHVLTRNFPQTVAQIRRQTGLGEGEHRSLLATTGPDGRPLVVVATLLQ